MHHLQDRSGQQIGDYRLQNYLGKGTFGTVYLAEHVHDRSLAAVKILQFQLSNREDLRDFLNEARIIRLRHPHIVSILDFGLSRDDLPFLVMEYALGGTLRNRHPRGSQVSSGTIATYVLHLASALQYAHDRRIIHRDVKPENMLLNGDSHVLLSDFGIAKIMEQSIAVSAQTQIGTPGYMAPEQSQGRPRPASDQYALAVVAYEWFTGQRPFQGGVFEVMLQHRVDKPPSLRTLRPEVSEQVEQVIFKALAKAPEERFPSVMDFAHALQCALQTTLPLIQTDPTGLTAETRDFSNAHLASIQLPPPTVPMTQQVPPSLATEYPFPKGTPDASIPSAAPFPESIPQANPATGISAQTRPSSWPDNKQEQGTSTYILPSTPPVELSWKSALRRPRHRWSTLLILLCLVVVIGACGSGAWLFVTHQAAQQNEIAATATAMAAPEARATTAVRAYWTATAKAGAQFGFDAAHTSWNPYERIITAKNVRGLRLLWSYATGDKIISSPTIANGTIYVGSNDHKMYAFDATCRSDCQPLRSYTTGDTIDSSPAIANGMVYIGSLDKKLYAFGLSGQS